MVAPSAVTSTSLSQSHLISTATSPGRQLDRRRTVSSVNTSLMPVQSPACQLLTVNGGLASSFSLPRLAWLRVRLQTLQRRQHYDNTNSDLCLRCTGLACGCLFPLHTRTLNLCKLPRCWHLPSVQVPVSGSPRSRLVLLPRLPCWCLFPSPPPSRHCWSSLAHRHS